MAGQTGFLGDKLEINRSEPATNKLRASTHQRSSACTVAIPGLATGPQNALCLTSVYRDCGASECGDGM
jgi:hypothetical protein